MKPNLNLPKIHVYIQQVISIVIKTRINLNHTYIH